MKTFILMSCLALAAARPEAGYNYNRPGGGGGSGGGSHGGGIGGSGGFGGSFGGGSGGFSGGSGGGGFGGGGSGGGGFGGGGSGGGFGGGSGGGFGGGSGGGFGGGSGGGFGGGSGGGFGGGIGGGFGGGGGGGGGTTLVQKHIYVHVPPPEQEEVRQRPNIPVGQSQKHYKIIFIKAPSAPSYQAPIIPLQPQNEEKTLVYVLVKKPEDQQDIVIPTAAPTQPSKPEVYFIKYKTQKDGGGGGLGVTGGSGGFSTGGSGGFSTGGGDGGYSGGDGGSSAPSTNYGPPGKSGPY
ncbi:GH18631 [Drosophila grimshawi]|uniref:GH18631 n=1 Tax=Drosophila grimshawi TaxID=7222 RepID=B4JHG8_DROGR|nr:GH18631 [Drosophila grimshawi]